MPAGMGERLVEEEAQQRMIEVSVGQVLLRNVFSVSGLHF